MVRSRKPEYQLPIAPVPYGELARRLVNVSPAFAVDGDAGLWIGAFPPPGTEYPMQHEPAPGEPNVYRDWLISVLEVLVDCYPSPVNMALDCLRTSLIEVNRGLTPNLFKPPKSSKGGKSNYSAQKSMNMAVNAALYIHDYCGNDILYEKYLSECGTSKREIDAWKSGRIDPIYRNASIVGWHDLVSALIVLKAQIENYRAYSSRKTKRAS